MGGERGLFGGELVFHAFVNGHVVDEFVDVGYVGGVAQSYAAEETVL